ncbi:MAG: hypothetical protein NT087_02590 [Deltaproteobacteria bacterium]|nr:hypothetical protein [Deltaproteobacteria bacterium]
MAETFIKLEDTRSAMPFRLNIKNRATLLLLCLLALAFSGCKQGKTPDRAAAQETPARQPACLGCHAEVRLDPNHNLACTDCHRGSPEGTTQEQAHAELISQPAHPDQMQKACGTCHAKQVAQAALTRQSPLPSTLPTTCCAAAACAAMCTAPATATLKQRAARAAPPVISRTPTAK